MKDQVRCLRTAVIAFVFLGAVAWAQELCSINPKSYDTAAQQSPEAAFAINELQKYAIAAWYSDNKVNGDYTQIAKELVATCGEATTMTLVVYGLPNKDCEANYSNDGSNKTPQDYEKFIQTLADIIGQRKILYVLEPDAVGLAAKEGGCGQQAGYKENIAKAIGILSANPNAEIYLDVGYWTLTSPETAGALAKVVQTLNQAGRIKGITLNTSNYRSNDELSKLCSNFQNAMGNNAMHCIIDSSRNYNGAPASKEWCNAKSGGIGKPPTSDTGFSNIDYLIWIKPPGESDGTCTGGDRTTEAMAGPAAGQFFSAGLASLWNNGYFVKGLNMPEIDGTIRTGSPKTPSPTETPGKPTAAPTTAPPFTHLATEVPTSPPTTQPASEESTTPLVTQPTSEAPTSSPAPTTPIPPTEGPTPTTKPEKTAPTTSIPPTETPVTQLPPTEAPIATQLPPTEVPVATQLPPTGAPISTQLPSTDAPIGTQSPPTGAPTEAPDQQPTEIPSTEDPTEPLAEVFSPVIFSDTSKAFDQPAASQNQQPLTFLRSSISSVPEKKQANKNESTTSGSTAEAHANSATDPATNELPTLIPSSTSTLRYQPGPAPKSDASANHESTAPPSQEQDDDAAKHEATTKTSTGTTQSPVFWVFMGLVAVGVAGIVAFVAVKTKNKRLQESKPAREHWGTHNQVFDRV